MTSFGQRVSRYKEGIAHARGRLMECGRRPALWGAASDWCNDWVSGNWGSAPIGRLVYSALRRTRRNRTEALSAHMSEDDVTSSNGSWDNEHSRRSRTAYV